MDPQKKILILHASAGHGHENAARAIQEACARLPLSLNVEVKDALSLSFPVFGRSYNKTYLLLIRKVPWLWGLLYHLGDAAAVCFFIRPFRRLANSLFARRLERFITAEDPAVIVCTHFFPAEVAAHLKEKKKIRSHLVTVITDYQPHAFWVQSRTDEFVVALPETRDELLRRGVAASKVQVFGIPIQAKFADRRAREGLSRELGLADGVFTVLVTSGGAGVGKLFGMVQRLLRTERPIQILVVCGMNRRLFERLQGVASGDNRLRVFGFIHNMEALMEVSDVVIGKSGGLTLTESLVKERPMIVIDPVPGQERGNASCVRKYGAGFVARSLEEAARRVEELLEFPAKLDSLKEGIRRMSRPRAAADIARRIAGMAEGSP